MLQLSNIRPTLYNDVFFLICIVGGGVQLGPLTTAATSGLLCQPRVIMMMEKLMEWDTPGRAWDCCETVASYVAVGGRAAPIVVSRYVATPSSLW
jgi:hypothetical protein